MAEHGAFAPAEAFAEAYFRAPADECKRIDGDRREGHEDEFGSEDRGGSGSEGDCSDGDRGISALGVD